MYQIKIRPLSVNKAYRGRRFATPELKAYKDELFYLLPRISCPGGKLALTARFGISSRMDLDNCLKAFSDSLQENYGFDDKSIYKWNVEKVDVKKGSEFIEFEIESYNN